MIKMELLKVDNQGFVEWLRSGNQEMCLVGERHEHAYFRHSLSNGLDILYMYDYMRDSKIPLHREPEYQGLYKRDTKELYDVSYDLNKAIEGTDIIAYGSANITEDIEGMVRRLVEEKVATYISTIKDTDFTEEKRESLRKGAWEIAKDKYLKDEEAGEDYECGYHEEHYVEHLMDFITGKEATAKIIADEHHARHKENIPEKIVTRRYVREELAKFNNGEYKHYLAMKQIIKGIPNTCKSVNVTVEKEGAELTFKYEARFLRTDCGMHYYTFYIPAPERKKFEELYGRHAEFGPLDIKQITYGKKVLYGRG